MKKLVRIQNKCEAGIGNCYGGSDSFLQFFRWGCTQEGRAYWWNINQKRIFEPLKLLKDDFKPVDKYYWYDMIWECFKNPDNRNPSWR